MRTNKALGDLWLCPELCKGHKAPFYEAVAVLLNKVCTQGPPPEWNLLTLHSIHKKGDPKVANNYRGIAVMSFYPKLLA